VPWVPMAFSGSLKIVSSERIELLDISMMEFSRILSQLGMGVENLLDKNENAVS
jgi:hypothetical protein